MIRMVIAQNKSLHGEALSNILKMDKNIEIIGEVRSCNELYKSLESNIPDIVLMDLFSNEIEKTINTSLEISEKFPKVKTIILSDQNEDGDFYNVINAGINGLVLKNAGISELQNAIIDVAKGGSWFSLELLHKVILGLNKKPKKTPTPKLSEREQEILELICESLTNEEIAKRLNISYDTVKWHRSNILSKTGVSNTAGLVVYAIKNKLINL